MGKNHLHWEGLTGAIGKLVSRHPGKIVLVLLGITVVMWFPLRRIDTSTKMSDYLPECEYLQADEKLRNEFDATFTVVSIITAESGNMLDKRGITVLAELDEAICSSADLQPYLMSEGEAVLSISDVIIPVIGSQKKRTGLALKGAGTFAQVGGALVGTLDVLAPKEYELADVPEDVLRQVVGKILEFERAQMLVSAGDGPERESAVMLVRFRRNKIPRDDETAELKLLEIMNKHLPKGYSMVSIAARNQNMEDDAKESLVVLLPISTGLVAVILILTLRSFADFFACMAGLLMTMIISFGLFSLLDLQFSQLTFFAPIVIMVLAIDYGIHLLGRYKEFRKSGLRPTEAMTDGIRAMGVSVIFSTVTTAVGFGANAVSKIPAVATFGLFLALGISVSLVVMMFFVPSLKLLYLRLLGIVSGKGYDTDGLSEGPVDKEAEQAGKRLHRRVISGIQRLLYSQCLAVIIIAVALCAWGLVLAENINKDMGSEEICAADSPVIQTLRIVDEKFPGIGMHRAYVLIEADLAEPAVMAAVQQSVGNMADDEHVAKIDGLPRVQSIIPYLGKLPRTRKSMIRALDDLYAKGSSKGEEEVTAGEVGGLLSRGSGERPYDVALLVVDTEKTQGRDAGKLIAELDEDVKPLAGVGKVSYAGFVFERYKIITEMTAGMNAATVVSIVLCAVVAVGLFRSLRFGLITALPIVLITGWILGTMYLLGFTLNMITATITAMSVGIGIDYCLHLTERYRLERREGKGITEAMTTSIVTTGPSLLGAGLTTICGFMVMSFSKIGMIKSFGILASLVILYALLSSLIVLPAMLFSTERIVDWVGRKRKK